MSIDTVFEEHSDRLTPRLERIVGSRETAEDLRQEAFLRTWRSVPRGPATARPTPSDLAAREALGRLTAHERLVPALARGGRGPHPGHHRRARGARPRPTRSPRPPARWPAASWAAGRRWPVSTTRRSGAWGAERAGRGPRHGQARRPGGPGVPGASGRPRQRPCARGEVVVAVVDGELRAAITVACGRVVADPFRPTAELVELLRLRAAQLRRHRRTGPSARMRRVATIALRARPV